MKQSFATLVMASLVAVLSLFAPAPTARADIFQWEFINPADPGQGVRLSSTLCPDGAGVYAVLGANLSYRDLTMAYLSGADLSPFVIYDDQGYESAHVVSDLTGVNLSQAELPSANFGGAALTGANFSQANLRYAYFAGHYVFNAYDEVVGYGGADLSGANLSQADLVNANFGRARLTGADLTGAEVRGANFANVTGDGITPAQLYSTASYLARDLAGIRLHYNNLTGVDLAGQNLTNAGFFGAALGGADFSQANAANATFYAANLTNANLSQANLANTKFSGATLIQADLSQANLANASFYEYFLDRPADLTGANLSQANLTNADLFTVTLTGANLTDALVRGASLYATNGFTAAQLYSTASYKAHDLTGISLGFLDLANVDLTGQGLANANFYSTTLTDANLSQANLTNANFIGATLTDANFTDAEVRRANLFYITPAQLVSTASYKARDLAGIIVEGGDYSGVNFAGQNLANARLTADLTGANFSEAEATNASFSGSALTGADFSRANLTKAQLSGTLTDADLSQANLTNALLDGATLTGADLSQANATNATFYSANLTNANLSQANLANAKLGGADLTGADLTDAEVRGASFSYIAPSLLYSTASYKARDLTGIGLGGDLSGVNLVNQNLTNAWFAGATLTGANLTGSEVRGATFTTISPAQLYSTASYLARDLTGIHLEYDNLTEVNLADQVLTDASFTISVLTGADFRRANAANATFHAANLTDANLSQANLANAEFGGATLIQADLSQANLTNASFYGNTYLLLGADLTGANLSQANLTNANFYDATLTDANLTGADVRGAVFHRAVQDASGITPEQLYSTASYQAGDLTGIGLQGNALAGARLSGQNLTDADFSAGYYDGFTGDHREGADLTGANLSRANLTNATFSGLVAYDDWGAEHVVAGANLSGANLSQANLANANFHFATLSGAVLTAADTRGAAGLELPPSAITDNLIRPDGSIRGLDLATGESLVVHDHELPITVEQNLLLADGAVLEVVLADAAWGSTMAVAGGVIPELAGTLRIETSGGFTPAAGERFTLLTFDAHSGRFAAVEGTSFPDGVSLAAVHSATDLVLLAVHDGERTWGVDASGNASLDDNWVGGIAPAGTGERIAFTTIVTAPRTVSIDAPLTVGSLRFDGGNGYTLAGPSPLTLQGAGGDQAAILVDNTHGDGSHTIAAPLVIESLLEIRQDSAGTLTLSGPLDNSAGLEITKRGSGAAAINGVQRHGAGAALVVEAGTLHLNSNAGAPAGPAPGAQAIANLALNVADGTLAINSDQDLRALHVDEALAKAVIHYQTDAGSMIRLYDRGTAAGATVNQATIDGAWNDIIAGSNAGAWNGNGINTTTVTDANTNGLGLVVESDSNGAQYLGLREMILGDVNADDFVDTGDATVLFTGLGHDGTWLDGDTNYDAFIDAADSTVLFAHLGQSFDPGFPPAAVPEPATLLLAACGLIAIAACRIHRRAER